MNRNTGFTLIEVLVAVVVLAIGLLGLAALQTTNLKNNQSAYYRSQATQLAYDIADRIRANAGAIDGYLSANVPVANADAQADCLAVSATCTAGKMAENDLYQWKTALDASLPGWAATIANANGVITVTVSWDDSHSGAANTSFQMRFQL